MKKNLSKQNLIYFCSLIATFFVGIIATIITINLMPKDKVKTIKDYSNVNITESDTINKSIEKVNSSVVYIASYINNKQVSSGTGFFYKKEKENAYLITNNHVVEESTKVEVTNNDGKVFTAKLLGTDIYSDLAVLSVPTDAALTVAKIGKSVDSKVGDTVFTIGSPLGIEYINSVTKGIVSGKDRTIEVNLSNGSFLMEVLQIDAAINPGNSGGPLCNINGEVIGVNSLKLVEEEVEGMGFAIPMEYVMTIVSQLETGKEVIKPLIGVEMLNANDTWQLYKNGITIDDSIEYGVVVVNLTKGMPAEKAGLKKGDVIVQFENEEVKSSAYFKYLLYKQKIGDVVEIKYYRDGKIKTGKMTLSESAK